MSARISCERVTCCSVACQRAGSSTTGTLQTATYSSASPAAVSQPNPHHQPHVYPAILSCSDKTPAALFFRYNTQLGPPYQVIIDTNFINFSIRNKIDLVKVCC